MSFVYRILPLTAAMLLSISQLSSDKKPQAAHYDPLNLEEIIDETLGVDLLSGGISKDEDFGFLVFDLINHEKLYSYNDSREFQAASMIKPFVALAYLHQVNMGVIKQDSLSNDKMHKMICQSDNGCTNYFMRILGGPRNVEHLLKENYPKILKDVHIEEYIPLNGRSYKNKASLNDYLGFLQALWDDKLPDSGYMKDLMSSTQGHRIRSNNMPWFIKTINKTGSTAMLCGDMGIICGINIEGRLKAYAFIGAIQNHSRAKNYDSWALKRGNIIRQLSSKVYTELSSRYGISAE